MEMEDVINRVIGDLIAMEPFDALWKPGCGRHKPFGNFGPWWIKRLYGTSLLSKGSQAVLGRRRLNRMSYMRSSGARGPVHVEDHGQICRREAPFGMFPNDSPA